jgi:aminoglycoside N3'-acetyltransferase
LRELSLETYRPDQLREALRGVGVLAGATVLVHSSLLHLGVLEGVGHKDVPRRICEIFLEILAEEGTLVVPTFSFAFCSGEPFDRRASPSESMGAFSEFVRSRPEARRSPHPMQSLAAIGAKASFICERDTAGAFDHGSPFDALVDLNARVVLLGATVQAVSLVHHAEQREEVPYRYWKEFSGTWRDRGVEEERTYRMFVRDLSLDPQLRLAPIEDELASRGLLSAVPVGGGTVSGFDARDFVGIARQRLRDDPLALLETQAAK